MKKNMTKDNSISLPLKAFSLSMLQGAMPVEVPAGSYNIPPNSQPSPHVTSPATQVVCQGSMEPQLDYLSFLFDSDRPLYYMDEIEQAFGLKFSSKLISSNKNGVSWQRHQGSAGSQYEYRKNGEAEGYRVRVTMGGEACSDLSTNAIVRALRQFSAIPGWVCTRIDYNVDDATSTLDLAQIAIALRGGHYAGYNCGEVIESHSLGKDRIGHTVYFGGRKSLKRTRFYDKAVESGLEYNLIRQETQLRGWRAEELCQRLIEKEADVLVILLGRLAGDMTFGIRHGKNLSRMRVAEFWTKWLNMLNTHPTKKPQQVRVRSLDRTLAWLNKSVARASALVQMIQSGLPDEDFWGELARKGAERLDESDIGNCLRWLKERGELEPPVIQYT